MREAIVKVSFEIASGFTLPPVTIPVAGSIYLREPIQPGDFGTVIPADAYLGGVSGLGGGTADLSQRGNLTALQFHAIGNANWPTSPDANAMLVQGPNGVILRDMGNACSYTQTPNGYVFKVGGLTITTTSSGMTIAIGGMSAAFSSTGFTLTGGEIDADGIGLKTHLSSAVQSGGGVSGPPVAGAGP